MTTEKNSVLTLNLGPYRPRVEERWRRWQNQSFFSRLGKRDPTLWFPDPTPEIADRLGWLDLPYAMASQLKDLESLVDEIRKEGTHHVVLLGMGGSSLAPEVFQRTFGNAAGFPELIVLDSTHPAQVRSIDSRLDLRRTFFIVSSKSGTTAETLSLYRYFWHRFPPDERGKSFVAITDPGTPLERLAKERSFRRVVNAPENVGGRFSALSVFGLLPAALIGAPVGRLLDSAKRIYAACVMALEADNSCAALGAALGELCLAKRDKVTFVTAPALSPLPVWIEQLIAESTGKEGKGIIPVVEEALGPPDVYGADRFFIHLGIEGEKAADLERKLAALEAAGHPTARIRLSERADLGQEFLRWEVAVSAAAAILGIHPFNQPDVELAKELARHWMSGQSKEQAKVEIEEVAASEPERLGEELRSWLREARAGDYAAIHAYIMPDAAATSALQAVRLAVRDRLRLATTLGYGPRFLHSTGQLHKGGPNQALILQLVDEPSSDIPVPETDYTFGSLIRAQALGDYQALKQRGRRIRRINLGRDAVAGVSRLKEALGTM